MSNPSRVSSIGFMSAVQIFSQERPGQIESQISGDLCESSSKSSQNKSSVQKLSPNLVQACLKTLVTVQVLIQVGTSSSQVLNQWRHMRVKFQVIKSSLLCKNSLNLVQSSLKAGLKYFQNKSHFKSSLESSQNKS